MDEIRRKLERAVPQTSSPLFGLGRVEVSEDAIRALLEAYGGPDSIDPFLLRHSRGDWPELIEHEREMNASAIEGGHTITARYTLPKPPKEHPGEDACGPNEAIAIRTEAEVSPGRRVRTSVKLAQVVEFQAQTVKYKPNLPTDRGYYVRIVRRGASEPRGYTKETGPFPSSETAMDAFVQAKRSGPWPLWDFRIRFYDFDTGELLRED